jgi:DNA-binding transcriptional LysR family regulator
MTNNPLSPSDFHLLHYFAVAAEENNLRRAAERLFMSQPPLSRHIKRLEERLGLTLFIRHTKGLALTEDGARVLETIRPLLQLQAKTFRHLAALAKPLEKIFAVGFTTAFEQGVFAGMETEMRERYGQRLRVARKTSPDLARDVRKGRLDAALVALPLEAPGLTVMPLPYGEPLTAALPATWPEAKGRSLSLLTVNGKPLFWFRRESNPAFFDYSRDVFAHAGIAPKILEEPAEHDVLLARIAAGEGMGLLPASFAAIRRNGVVFVPIREGSLLRVQLGLVTEPGQAGAGEELARLVHRLLATHC